MLSSSLVGKEKWGGKGRNKKNSLQSVIMFAWTQTMNMFETTSKEIKKRLHIYNSIRRGAGTSLFTSERWQIDGNSNGFRCKGKREYMCEGGVSVFFCGGVKRGAGLSCGAER